MSSMAQQDHRHISWAPCKTPVPDMAQQEESQVALERQQPRTSAVARATGCLFASASHENPSVPSSGKKAQELYMRLSLHKAFPYWYKQLTLIWKDGLRTSPPTRRHDQGDQLPPRRRTLAHRGRDPRRYGVSSTRMPWRLSSEGSRWRSVPRATLERSLVRKARSSSIPRDRSEKDALTSESRK